MYKRLKRKYMEFYRIFKIIAHLISLNKKIVLMNTPVHGNLGDHAIAEGEEIFIREYFDDYKFIEIEEDLCHPKKMKIFSFFVRKSDIIMLQGGGFMGDLWPRHEQVMYNIVNQFRDNIKIVMPQTCYLMNLDNRHVSAYARSYSKARKIMFIARDENSYNILKKIKPADSACTLSPDIALINNIKKQFPRQGITLCLRDDKEKVSDEAISKIVTDFATENHLNINNMSTVISNNLAKNNRSVELGKIWSEISQKRLFVTDRLHGMIFAAITGTPCIALDNLSGKVSGVYQWIKHLEYISCIDSKVLDDKLLKKQISLCCTEYKFELMEQQFRELAKAIKHFIKENA